MPEETEESKLVIEKTHIESIKMNFPIGEELSKGTCEICWKTYLLARNEGADLENGDPEFVAYGIKLDEEGNLVQGLIESDLKSTDVDGDSTIKDALTNFDKLL